LLIGCATRLLVDDFHRGFVAERVRVTGVAEVLCSRAEQREKCLDVAAIVRGAEFRDHVFGHACGCGVILLCSRDVPQVLDQSVANAIDRQHITRRRAVRAGESQLGRNQIAGGNAVEQIDA